MCFKVIVKNDVTGANLKAPVVSSFFVAARENECYICVFMIVAREG